MAKSKKKSSAKKVSKVDQLRKDDQQQMQQLPHMSEDVQKRMDEVKDKLELFKKKIIAKFESYVMGLALLPPSKDPKLKDKISLLILVDDTDSVTMPKMELREKLQGIMSKMAVEQDERFLVDVVILSEVWQSCYDGKYELLQMIAMSAPIYDKGMLAAIKISEIHKTMVLKKFEKYIVSYVLAGSLVQGKATPKSDVDVFIVIDDTDVKKMTRAELKDKLRAIIIGMGIDTSRMTGIDKSFNIQVYILTDFWDNIKEANPVIFTFLRDGIPFFDRGIFMPWKQLLRMGKVKPSPEAIDMFMSTGGQMIERIKLKLKEIGMEDTFYSILTPSQAAIMLYGLPPPTPKETPTLMRDVFVTKEKMLEEEFVGILEHNIQVRKDLEHGDKKEVSGAEIDKLVSDAERYLKRLRKLFSQIEKKREQHSVVHAYENVITVIRDVMRLEGLSESVPEDKIVETFEQHMVHKGLIPERFVRLIHDVQKAKHSQDESKLQKTEIGDVQRKANEIIKFMVEYIQRKRGRELEKTKIRVKHGDLFGEVILLGKEAFIIHDIDKEDRDISRAEILESGKLGGVRRSTMEELEHALVKVEIAPKVFVRETIFESLKEIFGKDVQILVNY
ncbi:MAG: nucleotidyltransferase domain-containing protein [Nanoarchaeota archaeon]